MAMKEFKKSFNQQEEKLIHYLNLYETNLERLTKYMIFLKEAPKD
jgi:hypothetical protein